MIYLFLLLLHHLEFCGGASQLSGTFTRCVSVCVVASAQQETIDPRRPMVMGNQVIDARGRKFTKRVVDIRELNEQARVIDDLKYDPCS